jgi:hypothetical protein
MMDTFARFLDTWDQSFENQKPATQSVRTPLAEGGDAWRTNVWDDGSSALAGAVTDGGHGVGPDGRFRPSAPASMPSVKAPALGMLRGTRQPAARAAPAYDQAVDAQRFQKEMAQFERQHRNQSQKIDLSMLS